MIARVIDISASSSKCRWLAVGMAPSMVIIMGIDLRLSGNEWMFSSAVDYRIRGWAEMLIHGIADEIAHLLTALVIFAAIRMVGLSVNWPAAAIGAVVIDTEYILLLLNVTNPVGDSTRGVAHTLGPALLIIALGLVVPPARVPLVSLGTGMLTHILRDSATASTPLLWPLSGHSFHLRYPIYLAVLLTCTVVVTGVVAHGCRPSPADAAYRNRTTQ